MATKYTPAPPTMLDETAVRIAIKVIRQFEGCNLIAYPDPDSDLYKALSAHNLLRKYMRGEVEIPDHFEHLSGGAWTCGWGETEGVKQGDVWTQEEADTRLEARVRGFMSAALKSCPRLVLMRPSAIAACTSLSYNIGKSAFSTSTVCKRIMAGDSQGAADAFMMWNKPSIVIPRRKIEADLFRSV